MKIFRLFIALTLICFALSPSAQAVVPAPDGGYPNFTTAEGDHALQALTTGVGNTAIGTFSLFGVTTGNFNTAVGALSLDLNQADSNTATGVNALKNNTQGTINTANGAEALFSNTTGNVNTANGAEALFSNTTGNFNTANGVRALQSNTNGTQNTATGGEALRGNTTGVSNTANGFQALHNSTTGDVNTANGAEALFSNTTGGFNTANGVEALLNNTIGAQNTADGADALRNNTTGNFNTANGVNALFFNSTGNNNTANGIAPLSANTTGNGNTALGVAAGNGVTTADGVICIGANLAGVNTSNSCFIGNIWDQPGGSQAVYINSDGKLGFQVSSRRFKDEIRAMEQASEVIYGLKPVSFRYKPEIEPTRPVSFGLIAEDVEKISPDLVMHGSDGKVNTVRYDAVNAMLLNEFLKEHRKVEDLKNDFQAVVAQQQKEIAALVATVKEQASQIQKVSAEVETSKFATGRIRRGGPAPQVVNNP